MEAGNLASAGGLSSGIDLALRVVERYYGRTVALSTADQLEYQGTRWMLPGLQPGLCHGARLHARSPALPRLRNGRRSRVQVRL